GDLEISWTITRKLAGETRQTDYGKTVNHIFVTGAAVTNQFETVLEIGCRMAEGERPRDPNEAEPGATNHDKAVVDSVWELFATTEVHAFNGDLLKYYGDGVNTPLGTPSSTASLLAHDDGRCGEWGHFLQDILTAQGIQTTLIA